jgi:hypothetical protein
MEMSKTHAAFTALNKKRKRKRDYYSFPKEKGE